MNLALDAADIYTGYQFKVETPEGLSYVVDSDDDVECELGEGHVDHEAVAHWNEEERLLSVVVASMNLSTFNGQSLSLQIPLAAPTMPLGTYGDFKIKGITFIKQDGEKVKLGDVSFNVDVTTGINGMAMIPHDGHYYTPAGILVVKPVKGHLYIRNGKKELY